VRFAVLVVLGLALFTAGCGDDDGETSSSPTATVEAPIPDPMSVGGLADGRPEGEVHVLGFVVIDAAGVRFCVALLESFPPQCGDPSVELVGAEDLGIEFEEDQGVRWTDDVVILQGRYADGVFTAVHLD